MKVKFNTEELKKRLSQLGAVVSKKATLPVFAFVRLLAVPGQQVDLNPPKPVVMLSGVDIDASLTVTIVKAEAEGEVDILLSFNDLIAYVGNISQSETIIEVSGETKAQISAGRFKAVLKTHPLTNWPQALERPEASIATVALVGIKDQPIGFKDQIAQVDFAVPASDGKFVVSVAKVESDGKALSLIATDGFRLAISAVPQNAGVFSLTLPKPALELIKKLEGTQVSISEADAGFYFDTETETLTINKTHGAFPNYVGILPKSFTTQITVKKKDLLEAVKLVVPAADKEKAVVFFRARNGATAIQISAGSNDAGTDGISFHQAAENEIDATIAGAADVSIPLDAKLLLPYVEKTYGGSDGDILIQATEATKIVDFYANAGQYRFLQMPVQGVEVS